MLKKIVIIMVCLLFVAGCETGKDDELMAFLADLQSKEISINDGERNMVIGQSVDIEAAKMARCDAYTYQTELESYKEDLKKAMASLNEELQNAQKMTESDEDGIYYILLQSQDKKLEVYQDSIVVDDYDHRVSYSLENAYQKVEDTLSSLERYYDENAEDAVCWVAEGVNNIAGNKLSATPLESDLGDHLTYEMLPIEDVKDVRFYYDGRMIDRSDYSLLSFKDQEQTIESLKNGKLIDGFSDLYLERIDMDVCDILQRGSGGPEQIDFELVLSSDYRIRFSDVRITGCYVEFIDSSGNAYFRGNYIGERDMFLLGLEQILSTNLGSLKDMKTLAFENDVIKIESADPLGCMAMCPVEIFDDPSLAIEYNGGTDYSEVIITDSEGNRYTCCG